MNDPLRNELPSQIPDLTACEREPIHSPGAIEPNGAMLVLGEDALTILQASSNIQPFLKVAPETLLGMRLTHLFSQEVVHQFVSAIKGDGERRYIAGLRAKSGVLLDALVHRYKGLLIIEFEPGSSPIAPGADVFGSLTTAMAELGGRLPLTDLCQRVAVRIRSITGFDRVMVYRFLEDDTGCVVAEDKREDIVPYLGLRYPASDIPAQARRLYLLNTLRLKADVNAPVATLVPSVNPFTGTPLDMTYCVLRAMSPVHVEYLRNMGVASSMSISIVKDHKLWGLIACHHSEAKIVAQPVRITCEVLARVFSSHIAKAEEEGARAHVTTLLALTTRIEERMRKDHDVVAALSLVGDDVAAVIGAQGCAFVIRGETILLGTTPSRVQVEGLSAWLSFNQRDHLFSTERLSAVYANASEFDNVASGLLSVRIALGSPDFVLWFRPSVTHVITWAGDPDKPVEKTDGSERIGPRRSFAKWQQIFHDRSEQWTAIDRTFAAALRPVIAETLFLRMNEEVLRLNLELARSNAELSSFAYSASHDLQEPVRTIRVYAQLVSHRAGPEMEPEARSFLAMIEDAAARMASLITALLSYSQLGGIEKRSRKGVNLEDVFDRVLANLDAQVRQTGAIVTHDTLPVVFNDDDHMVQVLQNLISNALKYRGEHAPRIHLTALLDNNEWLFCVRDNGQGFDSTKSEFIFEPFKRLHGREVPGNGIGLASCKRIVEISKGRIWAESDGTDQGAKFWFTLPVTKDQYKCAVL
jgi:chemotaxis family two-component system sensor kinase Cph1